MGITLVQLSSAYTLFYSTAGNTQKHQLKTIHFCHAQKCVAVPKAV